MTFVADESVDKSIVDALRHAGHSVLYVAESYAGCSDSEVLGLAHRRGAKLLTSDKDFGELVFRQAKNHAGVILLRLEGLKSSEKASITVNIVTDYESQLSSGFAVVTPTGVRMRK